jgi:hypothetical protein
LIIVKAIILGVRTIGISREGDVPTCPLPPAQAAEARRWVEAAAKKKGRCVQQRTLRLAEWVLIFTTLPPAVLPTATIAALYRVRWQEGLVIKRLKSLLDIDRLRPGAEHVSSAVPSWQAPATLTYRIEGALASRPEQRTLRLQRTSCFVLATNPLDRQALSDEAVLRAHKDQQKVERGFRLLEDPLFLASSLYLKSPKRLRALMRVIDPLGQLAQRGQLCGKGSPAGQCRRWHPAGAPHQFANSSPIRRMAARSWISRSNRGTR